MVSRQCSNGTAHCERERPGGDRRAGQVRGRGLAREGQQEPRWQSGARRRQPHAERRLDDALVRAGADARVERQPAARVAAAEVERVRPLLLRPGRVERLVADVERRSMRGRASSRRTLSTGGRFGDDRARDRTARRHRRAPTRCWAGRSRCPPPRCRSRAGSTCRRSARARRSSGASTTRGPAPRRGWRSTPAAHRRRRATALDGAGSREVAVGDASRPDCASTRSTTRSRRCGPSASSPGRRAIWRCA